MSRRKLLRSPPEHGVLSAAGGSQVARHDKKVELGAIKCARFVFACLVLAGIAFGSAAILHRTRSRVCHNGVRRAEREGLVSQEELSRFRPVHLPILETKASHDPFLGNCIRDFGFGGCWR